MASPVPAIKSKIMRRFASGNAFDEQTAKSLSELNLENRHSLIINNMIRRGQIIKTQDERYYMSPQYYGERSTRILWVGRVVVTLAVILIILYLFHVL